MFLGDIQATGGATRGPKTPPVVADVTGPQSTVESQDCRTTIRISLPFPPSLLLLYSSPGYFSLPRLTAP